MIRFYKPTLKRKDMDSVLQTMVDEQIGPGERAQTFMQAYSATVGMTYACAYRTYQDCIESALKLCGAQNGTKVALSLLTPIVYKHVLENLGCEIVYVDVDKENGLPGVESVSESGAEILVLYESNGTLPMKYNTQTTYAEKCEYENVQILEDVTQSIGGVYKDEAKPGDWGKTVVCSFEEDCTVSSAGGAGLAVKGDTMYALRNKKPEVLKRMTDLNASLGMVQLLNLEENCSKRREILKIYQQNLSRTNCKQFGLNLVEYSSSASAFSVLLETKPEEVIKFAEKHDTPVKMTFENCCAREYDGDLFKDFPVSAAYYYRCVSFPIYPFLKGTDVDNIAKIIAHLPS